MKLKGLCCTLLLLLAPLAFAAKDGPATLPKIEYATAYASTPTPGAVTPVTDLQAALNNAQCGDVLVLTAGATYTGNYVLPAKSCDDLHYIQLRSSSPDSVNGMPGQGGRITPCRAGVTSLPGRPAYACANPQKLMAKIISTKGNSPFTLADGANHYRLGPGLEITRPEGTGITYALINKSPLTSADHIIVDRDWVHGTAHDDTARGIFLSGVTYAAVISSYFNDFHCTALIGACTDSQAVAGGTGPTPQGIWSINNNFLEAAAENILFGGVIHNSVTPGDITIRRNYFFKPLTWMPGQPNFVGGLETATQTCPKQHPLVPVGQCPFVVKNLFELKNAQRVLLQANILNNVWAGYTQHGGSILISGLNPPAIAGAPVYSVISVMDFTLRYNRIANSTAGITIANMAGQGDGTAVAFPNLPVARGSIHDNIFDNMSLAYLNGDGTPYSDFEMVQVTGCGICVPIADIVINHNTMLSQNPRTALLLGVAGTQQLGLTYTNNIMSVPAGLAVISASGGGSCGTGPTNLYRLNACLVPNYLFGGNVLIGATTAWPSGNFFPATANDVQFVNYNNGSAGDYTLSATSVYKNAGTDGTDPGANTALVAAMTVGVQ